MNNDNPLVNPKNKKVEAPEDKLLPSEYEGNLEYKNTGGKVGINLSTHGRFGSPEKIYFSDFTAKHIDDMTLCKPVDLLEILVSVLNETKFDTTFDIGDLLVEEFTEVLLGLKQSLHPNASKAHPHRWLCKCQYKNKEDDRVLSETTIDLFEIAHRTIYEVDESIKEFYRNRNVFTEEQLEKLEVMEPFHVTEDGVTYSFRLNRISDLIKASKMAEEKFNPKIHRVKARQVSNKSLDQVEYEKEIEIRDLEEQKAKYALKVAKALTLVSIDNEVIPFEQKLNKFDSMSRKANTSFQAFLRMLQVGIYDEREFICNICNKHKERGYLQQRINPIELIPLSNDENTSSNGGPQIDPTVSILFGTKA